MSTAERWARGTGSGGIGVSGHINQYSPGVLIGNFNEEIAGVQLKSLNQHVLGYGAPFAGRTIQSTSFTPEGKSGQDLVDLRSVCQPQDGNTGLAADMLFRHGDFRAPQDSYWASMNQLTYRAHRQHGEPRVDAYTWSGKNLHDAAVPLNTQALSLTSTKTSSWVKEGKRNMHETTARGDQLKAALQAATQPTKQLTLKPPTDGEPPTVGRKPTGPHANEVDKVYRRNGLRNVYYSGNMA